MKNLIIVLLSVGLFFGFVLLPQVVTAQIKAPQESQRKRSYEPKFLGGKVNWMTFEEAEKAQKEQPKKVFVKVYAEWCGWCKRLDKATFADKRVADYLNENYYAVKFDAQHPDPVKLSGKEYTNPRFDTSKPKRARNATHQLTQKYGARSYPTVLFLNEKMDLIRAITGYRDADAFLPILEQFNQTTVPIQTQQAKPAIPNKRVMIDETQRKAFQQRQQRTYEPKVPGGKVNWMTFEEVEKAQKEQPKKVFVKAYTEWCGWCKRLDKATFADKRVADYINENYYAVKFDAQHPDPVKLGGKEYTNPKFDTSRPKNARNATHQLALKYGARSYPTLLFLNEKMGLIRAIPGYRDADAFLPILEQFNQTTITATPPEAKPKPALPAIIQLPKPEAEVLINWMTFEEAQAAMKNKPKKLLVDVYTHWCGPCKMMDRNTFSNPKLAEYINENYYPVKFNAQEENDIVFSGKTFSNPDYNPEKGQHRRNAKHQLAVDMNISALPTIVILNERLDIIHSTKGYKEPKDLRPVLEQFSKM